MNRLVLIDGNAILHRAYHAIPPLTSPKGTLVNAVYGFTSMLLRLKTDLAPTQLIVCFDRPKPTFRKELFAGYQAKRPKMDDELVGQIGIVHDVVQAFQVPMFEMDGFEADDIIGTIVKQSKKQVDEIIIVTGDRDLLQLVDDHVFCYMPTKGLSEAKLYGEKEAYERLGVDPKQVADYKALAGDQSDNYPGVVGIGPKTAQELLKTYHSVEQLYATLEQQGNLEGVSHGVMEKLRNDKENAFLSKTLATIHTDVPLEMTKTIVTDDQFTNADAITLLEHLGFQSLVKRLTKKENRKENPKKEKTPEEKKSGEQLQLV